MASTSFACLLGILMMLTPVMADAVDAVFVVVDVVVSISITLEMSTQLFNEIILLACLARTHEKKNGCCCWCC